MCITAIGNPLMVSSCYRFPYHNPKSLATTCLPALSIDSPNVDSSYKWNHTTIQTCCVWLLSLSVIFLRFLHTTACISTLIFFNGQIVFHYMDIPHFVSPFLHWLWVVTVSCFGCCEYHRLEGRASSSSLEFWSLGSRLVFQSQDLSRTR